MGACNACCDRKQNIDNNDISLSVHELRLRQSKLIRIYLILYSIDEELALSRA